MKRNPFLLAFIVLITLFALLVNIPQTIHINVHTPEIPVYGKEIRIDQSFPGFTPHFSFGPIQFDRDLSIRKGLDLEGGTSITLLADMSDVERAERETALESAKQVIERRVNFFGVSEPVVQTAKVNDQYRIIVEIPGVTDVHQAVELIGTTAKLTFWEEGSVSEDEEATTAAQFDPNLPLNSQIFLGNTPVQTDLSGKDLEKADVIFDQNTGAPVVSLQFTSDGTKKFADITSRNIGKRLGFALDNIMIDAPYVQTVIPDGNAIIEGGYTLEHAKQLQLQLNAGALPVSLDVLEQRSIGATLGQKSLERSLIAGIIGFVVIVTFMIAVYGRLGVVASISLVIYTLINLSIFRLIPITLTLAGIAGFILSIGIAVDANILIFERMREELRRGKSRDTAISLGFSRAWTSIRDSNMASLITSAILYYFGTGIVRGFALVLAIGVLISMFSAITVTRTFLLYFYKK